MQLIYRNNLKNRVLSAPASRFFKLFRYILRFRAKTKRAFTLIEIVVCLAIVSMIGTLVVFKTSSMLSFYRFSRQVAQLENECALTRNLSIAYHTDIELLLERTDKGLLLKRSTDEPMPEASRHLERVRCFSALTSMESDGDVRESLAITYFGNDPSHHRPVIKVCGGSYSEKITM